MRAYSAGDYRTAAELFTRLIPQVPRHPVLYYRLAVCEATLGWDDQAIEHLRKALKIKPEPEFYCQLAGIYRRNGDLRAARDVLNKALRLSPDHPAPLKYKADLYMMTGEHERALDLITRAERKGVDSPLLAIAHAAVCIRMRRLEEGKAVIEKYLADPKLRPWVRRSALFRMGELCDKLGLYDEAFGYFKEGNDLFVGAWSPEVFEKSVDLLIERWTKEAVAALPRASSDSDLPFFIIGMPRSGSSLVEQIIDSHPDVHGGGEMPHLNTAIRQLDAPLIKGTNHVHDLSKLTQDAVDRVAEEYLGKLRLLASTPHVSDKNLFNFEHLGMISVLFPRARVIHSVRNALDTCLSCYFQEFGGTIAFSFNIDYLGAYYQQYRRLMEHWKQVLDIDVLDVVYEELVGDQENGTHRILDHLGLSWHEDCLRFYKSKRVTFTASNDQVRRPMYKTSIARHERYANHIAPFRKALGMADDES
jgi:tetratricopeptide (TPR) repeat protein